MHSRKKFNLRHYRTSATEQYGRNTTSFFASSGQATEDARQVCASLGHWPNLFDNLVGPGKKGWRDFEAEFNEVFRCARIVSWLVPVDFDGWRARCLSAIL
jgi:hypothetical protein